MLPGTSSRLLWVGALAPLDGVLERSRDRSAFERQVRADLEAHPPLMDVPLREGIALEAYHRANLPRWFPTADELAEALSIAVLRDRDALDGQAALEDEVIAVHPSARYPSHEQLGTFHELGHHLLADRHHSHGDVWLLGLALAIPRDRWMYVRFFRQHIPPWAVALRLEQLGE